jgi:hypothetical protein
VEEKQDGWDVAARMLPIKARHLPTSCWLTCPFLHSLLSIFFISFGDVVTLNYVLFSIIIMLHALIVVGVTVSFIRLNLIGIWILRFLIGKSFYFCRSMQKFPRIIPNYTLAICLPAACNCAKSVFKTFPYMQDII